jgi:hypothetical protein
MTVADHSESFLSGGIIRKVGNCTNPHGWKKRPKKELFYQVLRFGKGRFAGSIK